MLSTCRTARALSEVTDSALWRLSLGRRLRGTCLDTGVTRSGAHLTHVRPVKAHVMGRTQSRVARPTECRGWVGTGSHKSHTRYLHRLSGSAAVMGKWPQTWRAPWYEGSPGPVYVELMQWMHTPSHSGYLGLGHVTNLLWSNGSLGTGNRPRLLVPLIICNKRCLKRVTRCMYRTHTAPGKLLVQTYRCNAPYAPLYR